MLIPFQRLNNIKIVPQLQRVSQIVLCGSLLASTSVLSADNEMPEEVLVTATRLARSIEDIAGTVSLITDEDIEQTIMEDLNDLVRYQPGVSMSTASRGGNEGFVIRGIGGNRILMMVDGVRSSDLYSAGPASYGKDSFEIDDLKAVEIIRGPASVMYGADAMGGAVILRSKSPADYLLSGDASSFRVRGSYNDSNDMGKLGFTGVKQFGDLTALAQYTRRDFSEREVKGNGSLNPQEGSNDALSLKLDWAANENWAYMLTLDVFQEDLDTELLSELSPSVQEALGQDETDRYRASLAWGWTGETVFADSLNAQIYWQETDALQQTSERRTSYSFLNPANPATYGGSIADRLTDFVFIQETAGFELGFQKQFSGNLLQNSLVYGFNYETTETKRPRNRCDLEISSGTSTCAISAYPFAPAEVFPNKTFPDTETLRSGIYLQDEVVLADSGFTLIPGVRYDRYEMEANDTGLLDTQGYGFPVSDFTSSEVSFNLGLIYNISESTSVFVQYAEGFRPPNFNEANQSFVNLGFAYALLPNPELREETSKNLEAGFRSSFGNTSINLAIYSNDYEDFIETEFAGTEGGLSLFQEQNISSVEIYGAELQASQQLNSQWNLHGSLAYSRGDNKESDLALNSVEPLTAVLGLSFDSTDQRWGFEAMLTAVADKDRVANVGDVEAESYEVVDLIAHYNIADATMLRLGIFNIFDTEYAHWSNIQGLTATSTDAIQRSQESGVNVRLSFRHQF